MKTVPFDRSHIKKAVVLHQNGAAWFYAGKTSAGALKAFYDGYANRDYTLAVAVVEGERLLAAACAATDFEKAAYWFNRRRIWRDLGARLAAGPNLSRGGYDPATFEAAAGYEGKKAYVVALLAAKDAEDTVYSEVVRYLSTAAASRGVRYLFAASAYAPADTGPIGFQSTAGGLLMRGTR